jgi:hypothetical protein
MKHHQNPKRSKEIEEKKPVMRYLDVPNHGTVAITGQDHSIATHFIGDKEKELLRIWKRYFTNLKDLNHDTGMIDYTFYALNKFTLIDLVAFVSLHHDSNEEEKTLQIIDLAFKLYVKRQYPTPKEIHLLKQLDWFHQQLLVLLPFDFLNHKFLFPAEGETICETIWINLNQSHKNHLLVIGKREMIWMEMWLTILKDIDDFSPKQIMYLPKYFIPVFIWALYYLFDDNVLKETFLKQIYNLFYHAKVPTKTEKKPTFDYITSKIQTILSLTNNIQLESNWYCDQGCDKEHWFKHHQKNCELHGSHGRCMSEKK